MTTQTRILILNDPHDSRLLTWPWPTLTTLSLFLHRTSHTPLDHLPPSGPPCWTPRTLNQPSEYYVASFSLLKYFFTFGKLYWMTTVVSGAINTTHKSLILLLRKRFWITWFRRLHIILFKMTFPLHIIILWERPSSALWALYKPRPDTFSSCCEIERQQ